MAANFARFSQIMPYNQDEAFYTIDLAPSGSKERPVYVRQSDYVLGEPPVLSAQFSSNEAIRPSRACWNCDSPDHELFGCPNPPDHAHIAQNRQAFLDQRVASGIQNTMRNTRLHDAEASRSQRLNFIARFRAGSVSPDLREAIGFSEHAPDFPWLYNFLEWGVIFVSNSHNCTDFADFEQCVKAIRPAILLKQAETLMRR